MFDEYQRQLRRIDLAILLVLSFGVLAIAVVAASDRSEQVGVVQFKGR